SLVTSGRSAQPVNFERGTAWLMANGWSSHSEPEPATLSEWRRECLPQFRLLTHALRTATSPKKVKLVVLACATTPTDRVRRLVEAADEELGEALDVVWVSTDPPAPPDELPLSLHGRM